MFKSFLFFLKDYGRADTSKVKYINIFRTLFKARINTI